MKSLDKLIFSITLCGSLLLGGCLENSHRDLKSVMTRQESKEVNAPNILNQRIVLAISTVDNGSDDAYDFQNGVFEDSLTNELVKKNIITNIENLGGSIQDKIFFDTKTELVQYIESQESSPIDQLILVTHGEQGFLYTDDKSDCVDNLSVDNISETSQLTSSFSKDAHIVLISCSTGKESMFQTNMASAISEARGVSTVAPTGMLGMTVDREYLTLTHQGKIVYDVTEFIKEFYEADESNFLMTSFDEFIVPYNKGKHDPGKYLSDTSRTEMFSYYE